MNIQLIGPIIHHALWGGLTHFGVGVMGGGDAGFSSVFSMGPRAPLGTLDPLMLLCLNKEEAGGKGGRGGEEGCCEPMTSSIDKSP